MGLAEVILDTSALIVILRDESESVAFASAIEGASVVRLSAASYVETACVMDGPRNPLASRRLDELLRNAKVIIEPFTEEQARIARAAYRDFGKGSRHPARLNLGDCFCYALAKVTGEPLLYKGRDFSCTDVAAAVPLL